MPLANGYSWEDVEITVENAERRLREAAGDTLAIGVG
jgi:hypothetical protein